MEKIICVFKLVAMKLMMLFKFRGGVRIGFTGSLCGIPTVEVDRKSKVEISPHCRIEKSYIAAVAGGRVIVGEKLFIKFCIVAAHTMPHTCNNLVIVRDNLSQRIDVLYRNNRSHSLRYVSCELNLMIVHMLIELMLTWHNNRSFTNL